MTRKATIESRDYFRASGAQLREWMADGDKAAEAEATRRKANRAAKTAERKAA